MKERSKYIDALINLHSGLVRLGPGDSDLSKNIIIQLPKLPKHPRIVDIGCGTGASALFLAKIFHTRVKAVDFSEEFLDQMMARAKQQGLADYIEPIDCDMAKLNWAPETIDLLWSEGAVYNIGFERALRTWRPLMALHGCVVISEMNYFTDKPSKSIIQFMLKAYPDIKTELENIDLINSAGYRLLGTERLPPSAWLDNYYHPLCKRMHDLKRSSDPIMSTVIADTEEEIEFFKAHHNDYGYTFYIMQAN